MENVTEKYMKGFNDGYLLKQHNPQLIENILTSTSNNDYLQGLKDGKTTHEQQRIISRSQELKGLKERSRDIDLER